jgi:hypothetical protein
MAAAGGCTPFFSESIGVGGDEFRVYRCDWGWCVKRGDVIARGRLLIDAFEEACGGARVDTNGLRRLVETLERALTEEQRRRGRTASTSVSLPVPAEGA